MEGWGSPRPGTSLAFLQGVRACKYKSPGQCVYVCVCVCVCVLGQGCGFGKDLGYLAETSAHFDEEE